MAGSYKEVVDALELIPHPEGGYFRETWRSGAAPMESRGKTDEGGQCMPSDRVGEQRNVMTSIYYLITSEHPYQWWVSNASTHVHYHHGGDCLVYTVAHPDGKMEQHRLGTNFAASDRPQMVVPGGSWKCARLDAAGKNGWALIGEGVAPGFDYRDFDFVTKAQLSERCPAALEACGDLVKAGQEDFEAYYDKS